MSSRLLVLAGIAAFAGASHTLYNADNPPIWRQLFTLFFSRGIYFILALLILGCFVISSIKNKIDEASNQSEMKVEPSWTTQGTVLKSLLSPVADFELCRPAALEEVYLANTNTDVLKEAEARNNALKKELEQLNRIRLSLEERSGVLEREKAAVEDELEKTKLNSALENESLRKEAAVFQRQLQQLQEEKDVLRRELDSAARESRMTDYALKDQILLAERLEAAKKEAAELQKGLEALRQERDTAVALAADLVTRCQGVAGESTTQMIGKYLTREMERKKLQESSEPILGGGTKDTHEEKQETNKPISRECSAVQSDDQESKQLKLDGNGDNSGSVECECPECAKQKFMWSDFEMINHQQLGACNELRLGPVTSSDAFRNFLISSFAED